MKPVESYKELVAAAGRQGCPMDHIEAKIMLGYMEGHDYQLAEDDSGALYRRDLAAGDPDEAACQPYTIRDALDFCIDMNEELLDLESKKDAPDTSYITQLEEDARILLGLNKRLEDCGTYFDFLDALRESGATNMFGAAPYLAAEFPELSKNHAQTILSGWMKWKGAQNRESG